MLDLATLRGGRRSTSLAAAAAALCLALAPTVLAQAPGAVQAPVELRFDIARYRVEGNTLLPAGEVERIVSAFAGKGRDFGDVQRVLEALQEAYRARGYSAVQVYLPEQELARGEVLLRVIEARIARLEVHGNKHYDEANVRRSLPALTVGATPNASVVAKNLRIANENPAKQTNVTLRAGAKEGEVDARVDVTDENPRKWFVTLDNTGTGPTGYHRAGIGYQDANLLGRDHAMTLQFITSVEKPSQVGIYSFGYHLPLYAQGASMDFVAAYSDVDAGTSQTPSGDLTFSGRGGVLGARYNWHLDHLAGYDHKVVFGIDHRMYRNTCAIGAFGAAGCGPAAATFSLTPVSLTYAGIWTRPTGRLGLHAGVSTNLGSGSPRVDTGLFDGARAGAKAHYWIVRAGLDWGQVLPGDWQFRTRLDLQHTDDVLVPPEQFGIGGANSVRGFLERELSNDRGHSGSLELYTPELAPRLGMKDWNMRVLAFYDFGRIYRVDPLPTEPVREGIASAGLGLRLALPKRFSLRFDLAQILDPGGTRERNHYRFAFASVWSF